MKNLLIVAIFVVLSFTNAVAAENNNFVQLRFEAGQNKESGTGFFGTRLLFENNSLQNWTLGGKIGTGQNNFMYMNPHALYKVSSKFKIGSIYMNDSLRNESVGPTVRYTDTFGGVSTTVEYSRYLDLHENNNLHDLWWSIGQNKKAGWKVGAEIWYFHYDEGTENFKLRPLKVSYIFSNGVTPFVMLQRHWNDKGLTTDAVLGGIELKF